MGKRRNQERRPDFPEVVLDLERVTLNEVQDLLQFGVVRLLEARQPAKTCQKHFQSADDHVLGGETSLISIYTFQQEQLTIVADS